MITSAINSGLGGQPGSCMSILTFSSQAYTRSSGAGTSMVGICALWIGGNGLVNTLPAFLAILAVHQGGNTAVRGACTESDKHLALLAHLFQHFQMLMVGNTAGNDTDDRLGDS